LGEGKATTMTQIKPTLAEFEVTGHMVKHVPTGAQWWWKYPGSQSGDVGFRVGRLGDVLPNGDDYDVYEVKQMALQVLASVGS